MSHAGQRWNDLDVKPCGTPAAYRRHLRHGERPCESCRQAERRRQQDRYRAPIRQARYQQTERVTGWAARRAAAPEWDGQPSYEVYREAAQEWAS
jgi:hypothetical protein